jgi:hypothetical protein
VDAREAAAAPAVQTAPGVAALPKVRDEFGLQLRISAIADACFSLKADAVSA